MVLNRVPAGLKQRARDRNKNKLLEGETTVSLLFADIFLDIIAYRKLDSTYPASESEYLFHSRKSNNAVHSDNVLNCKIEKNATFKWCLTALKINCRSHSNYTEKRNLTATQSHATRRFNPVNIQIYPPLLLLLLSAFRSVGEGK